MKDLNGYQVCQKLKSDPRTSDIPVIFVTAMDQEANETGEHIIRTKKYVKLLAEYLKDHQRFSDYLTDENIEWIFKTALLHDIGKVGIPDRILYKEGKLNKEEFAIIKKHTCYGREAIEKAEQNLGSNSFLKFARQIVGSHHEKWDGSGYPEGLKKEEIPIAARLMTIASNKS